MCSIIRDKNMKRTFMNFNGFDLEGFTMKIDGNLPSRGLHYKSRFVDFRGLRFKEKLLLSKIGDNSPDAEAMRVIAEAMRGAIRVEGIDIEDMIFDDFYLMFFWVCLLTDERYSLSFSYDCECGHLNNCSLSLSNGELVMEDMSNEKSFNLDTSLGKLTLTPPTLGNVIDFMSCSIVNEKDLRECVFIKRLNGSLLPVERRIEVMESLTMSEIDSLRDSIWRFKSKISKIKRKCEGCGKDREISLSIDLKKALP